RIRPPTGRHSCRRDRARGSHGRPHWPAPRGTSLDPVARRPPGTRARRDRGGRRPRPPRSTARRRASRARSCRIGLTPVPIHIRANPGDYAEACLLPGDPLRAKYIAETYLEDVVQRNGERGLLGYTGTYEGKPVSVQGTGMGCPGATIVFEELVQLGVKKLLRVGTCGGLQPHHELGDLIVALSAVADDRTADHLLGGEPHCP